MKKEFYVWSDIMERATFACEVATGKIIKLVTGGYIHNDLTVRKSIATSYRIEGGSRKVTAIHLSSKMGNLPVEVQNILNK